MSNSDPQINFVATGLGFLTPYICRELPGKDMEFSDLPMPEAHNIFITSDPEAVPPTGIATILRCPNIIGTGMTGFPMELASAIAGGRYYHVPGSECRLSTVHATDIARAVAITLDAPGDYTVTDLSDPTYDALADALAHRINDRRIYTLKKAWARLVMPRSLWRRVNRNDLWNGREFADKFNFSPTPVTEYLTSHVYDDESL